MDKRKGLPAAVVTIGEALIRVFPEEGKGLEQSDSWRVSVAGAEANVAIGLARLGIRSCWVSKLPRTPLGRKVEWTLRGAGVDVSRVLWTEWGRVGIYLTETGITPEDVRVWYDRAYSTFCTIQPHELEWGFLKDFGVIHFTGITPALGEGPRATVEEALENAVSTGLMITLDVNYRSHLWPPDEARETLQRLFRGRVNLIICSRKDAREVFGLEGDDRALRWLRDEMQADVVVLTRGTEGAVAWDGREFVEAGAYHVRILDRIGRGDALAVGVIDGFLSGDLERGVRQGCALAALAQVRWGDPVWTSREELESLLTHGPLDRR